MKVTVIDSPCGTGKTEYAIHYMNLNAHRTNFIYVTPFLDEVTRVRNSVCFNVYEPKEGSKSKDFLVLLEKGKSIVTTHALFKAVGDEIVGLLEAQEYELILDEVLEVIVNLGIRLGDKKALVDKDKAFVFADDGTVSLSKFGEEMYESGTTHKVFFDLIKTGRVIRDEAGFLLWEFPINILNLFKKVTIMTYMFDNQTMCNYLLANKAELDYYYLENYELISGKSSYSGKTYRDLVEIYEGKLNYIGDKDYSLSSSWFDKKENGKAKKILMTTAFNYLYNIVNARIEDTIWTIPDDVYGKGLFIKSYKGAFLVMNSRATNNYADRTVCAYMVNRFENPVLYNYFTRRGLSVSNELFALSELIQWLFRSAIRRGKPIKLYIPSKRMRTLLTAWLDGTFEERYNK